MLHFPRYGSSQLRSCNFRPNALFVNGSRHSRIHNGIVNRLSGFWIPIERRQRTSKEYDSHDLLLKAGYLRQAHSGVYHILPLGLRVQEKLESLIDKHMHSLGASKLSLSSITSEKLWEKSGRLSTTGKELLKIDDRNQSGFLLSPTHEEEITSLVSRRVKSYKALPLRLYQITRKYRDELRPRQGLLRAKEFLMKDLYTFDSDESGALQTYENVKAAYSAILTELKIPYMVADADSGNMGGSLSHEFHFLSSKGEDTLCKCNKCDYTANEEKATKRAITQESLPYASDYSSVDIWYGISHNRLQQFRIYLPKSESKAGVAVKKRLNFHELKRMHPDIDLSVSSKDAQRLFDRTLRDREFQFDKKTIVIIQDYRCSKLDHKLSQYDENTEVAINTTTIGNADNPIDITRIETGDSCPKCEDGTLSVHKAIEIGHTFHLGTRYSTALEASVLNDQQANVPMVMGCHGIGVSRLIGAVASLLATSKGLAWPRAIAPFEVVIVPDEKLAEDAIEVYKRLVAPVVNDAEYEKLDVVLDDRPHSEAHLVWKLMDADSIGYPVIVVLGKAWREARKVEVQCHRLGTKEIIEPDDLSQFVRRLLKQL